MIMWNRHPANASPHQPANSSLLETSDYHPHGGDNKDSGAVSMRGNRLENYGAIKSLESADFTKDKRIAELEVELNADLARLNFLTVVLYLSPEEASTLG